MKIDQRFYCIGCGATGDVIDFVAGVFGIGKRDAPKKTVETWHPFFCEALQRISYVEYLLDILLFGETEDRVAVIVCYGRRVMKLEKRIGELEAGNNGSFEMDNGKKEIEEGRGDADTPAPIHRYIESVNAAIFEKIIYIVSKIGIK